MNQPSPFRGDDGLFDVEKYLAYLNSVMNLDLHYQQMMREQFLGDEDR